MDWHALYLTWIEPYVDWVAIIICLVAAYYNKKKKPCAWLMYLGANVLWLIHFVPKQEWALILLNMYYNWIAITGYIEWKKDEKNDAIH